MSRMQSQSVEAVRASRRHPDIIRMLSARDLAPAPNQTIFRTFHLHLSVGVHVCLQSMMSWSPSCATFTPSSIHGGVKVSLLLGSLPHPERPTPLGLRRRGQRKALRFQPRPHF
jgi:hypothetical protein